MRGLNVNYPFQWLEAFYNVSSSLILIFGQNWPNKIIDGRCIQGIQRWAISTGKKNHFRKVEQIISTVCSSCRSSNIKQFSVQSPTLLRVGSATDKSTINTGVIRCVTIFTFIFVCKFEQIVATHPKLRWKVQFVWRPMQQTSKNNVDAVQVKCYIFAKQSEAAGHASNKSSIMPFNSEGYKYLIRWIVDNSFANECMILHYSFGESEIVVV